MMTISGWGNFPKINAKIYQPDNVSQLKELVVNNKKIIPFGNGRSYGDSSLGKTIIHLRKINHFIKFDAKKGLLHTQAGVTLAEILEIIVPKGWFLPVSPGTKFITVGGAIASDVHGKNHHIDGCFSKFVKKIKIIDNNGEEIECSKNNNYELFIATCGGMGLTGIIVDAQIKLKKIKSKNIISTSIKTKNIQETFKLFEKFKKEEFSVAWIDCFANSRNLGRSIFNYGYFAKDGDLNYETKKSTNIPFYFPNFFINSISMRIFNMLYYFKIKSTSQKIDLDYFFYPLDKILNWNKIYGRNGFLQYQFIVPLKNSLIAISEILKKINHSKHRSYLAILKLHGKENENWISFPTLGYSLALDFKYDENLFTFLKTLDKIVLKYNGKIYLTKDSRIDKKDFEKGYPQVNLFRNFRIKKKLNEKFESLQSLRLNL